MGKYRYLFRNICMEDSNIHLQDGSWTIFLNTKGTNEDEIPKELLNLLQYIGTSDKCSQNEYNDSFIRQLQNSINSIKKNREMGERYMLLEDFLKREKIKGIAEGKAESILQVLSAKLSVPADLSSHIMEETNLTKLEEWLKYAISSTSIEQFMENIQFQS